MTCVHGLEFIGVQGPIPDKSADGIGHNYGASEKDHEVSDYVAERKFFDVLDPSKGTIKADNPEGKPPHVDLGAVVIAVVFNFAADFG
eukprot:CAMPEP_0170487748 /NCGR_PEP_ID=MMETSP0208-20121228/6492_1 /TAXON_ID=197538 /ORGANISM="Strombidium inclinatum, Strain S3" /LENGTH=87 /DNA_ID=CAMNT_0010762125 /DNA_START=201 /DNA_END=460 /DNA_ORIENTATION=+